MVTTGIYCRPGCGAKPLAENVRTFELAASAEAAGFRACLRCRPYRAAGPIAAGAPELVCRAVQLIIEGVLDTGTEDIARGRGWRSRRGTCGGSSTTIWASLRISWPGRDARTSPGGCLTTPT